MASDERRKDPGAASTAVELMLHYANARASEDTWRGIVLGPGIMLKPTEAGSTPFGVSNLEEFATIQAELCELLDRVIALESAYAETARAIAEEIRDRAQAKFEGWAFSPITERLFERWDTKESSFREL